MREQMWISLTIQFGMETTYFNMATGTTNFAGESFKGFENAIMGNAVTPLPVMQPTIR
ncbi:hypothetical protein [Nitrosomonas ureae]|nr:hypothetical protein [Nitrosomonas ureae]